MRNSGISLIDQMIIDKVREVRRDKKLSQRTLAYMIDVSPSFIADVENYKRRAKYNFNHINRIAEALECDLWDLVPKKPVK